MYKRTLLAVFIAITLMLSVFSTTGFIKASPPDNIRVYINGKEMKFETLPIVINGRAFIPMRDIFESLGAVVSWDGKKKEITARRGQVEIKLRIGDYNSTVNGTPIKIDAAPFIYKEKTMVPLRFVSEALGEKVEWDQVSRSIYIGKGPYISSESTQLKMAGKTFKVNIVKVDLNNDKVGVKVVLAKDRIGEVEPLKSMAERHGAVVAINGTYFNAYEEIKEPVGNIMVNHKPIHLGNFGTTIGFTDDNEVGFDIVRFKINGITNDNGREIKWVAYAMNRTPAPDLNTIVLYTPERGDYTRVPYGTSVIIEDGVIKNIVEGDAAIPKNGFVLKLIGTEIRYLDRFPKGAKADFTVDFEPVKTDISFWKGVSCALGAGPRLITDGKITVDPVSEGFSSEKILTYSMARSAVGVTKDNKLLLVTVNSATIGELAEIMKSLGAYNAMNLDGGASSGLYYKGSYLTTPGRELSNALVIYELQKLGK
ncbi:phosphodiester glycosidase family protein [Thermovorax subterraneus]|nr:phosphodiester glycosidase family protein [Thermovorax subterraneus]